MASKMRLAIILKKQIVVGSASFKGQQTNNISFGRAAR